MAFLSQIGEAANLCTLKTKTCVDDAPKSVPVDNYGTPACPAGSCPSTMTVTAAQGTTDGCWKWQSEYECTDYNSDVSSCAPSTLVGCNLVNTLPLEYGTDNNGNTVAIKSQQSFVCESKNPVCFNSQGVSIDGSTCTGQALSQGWNSNPTLAQQISAADPSKLFCNTPFAGDYCSLESYKATCYASAPDLCNTDSNCTLVDYENTGLMNGIYTSQVQNYKCSGSSTCTEYKEITTCPGDIAHGLNNQEVITKMGTSQNLAGLAVVEAVSRGMNAASDMANIRVFNGQHLSCQNKAFSTLSGNCCSGELTADNMDDQAAIPKVKFFNCSEDDVKAVGARNGGRTITVGTTCDTWFTVLGQKLYCMQVREHYCAFDSDLARIVVNQGRAQLQNLVANSLVNIPKETIQQNYFSNGAGNWGEIKTVGNYKFSVWQMDKSCSPSTGNINEPAVSNQNAWGSLSSFANEPTNTVASCTDNPVYIAVCTNKQMNCSALPNSYQDTSNENWQIIALDSNQYNQTKAVSDYMIVKNTCQIVDGVPSTCTTEATALDKAVGGKGILKAVINYDPFSGDTSDSNPQYGGIVTSGSYAFKGKLFSTDLNEIPAQMVMGVSSDSGATWTDITIPSKIDNADYTINMPDGKAFRFIGGCDVYGKTCNYSAFIEVTIPGISGNWGNPDNPDCTGFSLDQMALLDFSKMDLSEYTSKISMQASNGVNPEAMVSQVNAYYQNMKQDGTKKVSDVKQVDVLNIEKTDLLAGSSQVSEAAKVVVQANWPYRVAGAADDNPVTRVDVDWGDGIATTLQRGNVPYTKGGSQVTLYDVYYGTHNYNYATYAGKTINITASVFTTKNGIQTVKGAVRLLKLNEGGSPLTNGSSGSIGENDKEVKINQVAPNATFQDKSTNGSVANQPYYLTNPATLNSTTP